MQQQGGALWQRQLVQQIHEFSLLLAPDEQVVRAVCKFIGVIGYFLRGQFPPFAPALDALLVRNPEKPAPKLTVLAQAADVPRGGNERLLHDVKTGLFVTDEFKNIDIKRQLIPPE